MNSNQLQKHKNNSSYYQIFKLVVILVLINIQILSLQTITNLSDVDKIWVAKFWSESKGVFKSLNHPVHSGSHVCQTFGTVSGHVESIHNVQDKSQQGTTGGGRGRIECVFMELDCHWVSPHRPGNRLPLLKQIPLCLQNFAILSDKICLYSIYEMIILTTRIVVLLNLMRTSKKVLLKEGKLLITE